MDGSTVFWRASSVFLDFLDEPSIFGCRGWFVSIFPKIMFTPISLSNFLRWVELSVYSNVRRANLFVSNTSIFEQKSEVVSLNIFDIKEKFGKKNGVFRVDHFFFFFLCAKVERMIVIFGWSVYISIVWEKEGGRNTFVVVDAKINDLNLNEAQLTKGMLSGDEEIRTPDPSHAKRVLYPWATSPAYTNVELKLTSPCWFKRYAAVHKRHTRLPIIVLL